MKSRTGAATRHDCYSKHEFTWRMIRDALAGSNAVKRANEIYLPMPQGFNADSTSPDAAVIVGRTHHVDSYADYDPQQTPFWHSNPAYRAYLQRARFPGITLNILRGLIGVATRNDAEYNLPDSMAYLEVKATKKGRSLDEVFVFCLAEVLSQGRVELAVDIDATTNLAYLVPYKTEAFINWRENEVMGTLQLAVLEEEHSVPGDTDFECKSVKVQAVYSYDTKPESPTFGQIVLTKYMDDEAIGPPIVPGLQGTPFDKIPVVPIGSLHNSCEPNPAPLEAIADIAFAIYRKDADLSQAQYMTCNPMFTISGAGSDTAIPTQFGSTVALLLDNPNAKAYFPETDTSALDHVKTSIQDLFEESARYGATLIGAEKTSAESTDTVKLRQGAQGATLVGSVHNVLKGMNQALKMIARLNGMEVEDDMYSISTEFSELMLSPQMLTALITCWQNGLYSKESLIGVLLRSGYVNDMDEVADELARIFSEGPAQGPLLPTPGTGKPAPKAE